MTTFDYNYQNSFRFCFVIEICQSRWGLKNNSPNLHKKTTNWRILVVVVKYRHRAIVLLQRITRQKAEHRRHVLTPRPFPAFPSMRVGKQGLFRPYLKTFIPPFLLTRLTAPGSPRMEMFMKVQVSSILKKKTVDMMNSRIRTHDLDGAVYYANH